MKRLLRLALLTIARVGLLTVLIVWGLCQWKTYSVLVPMPKGTGTGNIRVTAGTWEWRQIDSQISIGFKNSIITLVKRESHASISHERFMLRFQIEHLEARKHAMQQQRHSMALQLDRRFHLISRVFPPSPIGSWSPHGQHSTAC